MSDVATIFDSPDNPRLIEAIGRLMDHPEDYESVVKDYPELESELRNFMEEHRSQLNQDNLTDPTRLGSFGKYTVLYRLGVGGCGAVFLARDTELDRLVAIKVLREKQRSNAAVRASLEREGRLTAQFNHPNIPSIFEQGTLGDTPYVVMRLIEGESLGKLLDRIHLEDAAQKEGLDRVKLIAATLGYAHDLGWVHRDVKPGNLWIGPWSATWVLDWGLACREEDSPGVVGTLPYMAPEQRRGEQLRPASDVWALGVLIYEIISIKSPFPEGLPSDPERQKLVINCALEDLQLVQADPFLEKIVADCLAFEFAERPANGHEVAKRLAEYEAHLKQQAELRVKEQAERAHRRKVRLLAGMALLVVAGISLAWYFWHSSVQAHQSQEVTEEVIGVLRSSDHARNRAQTAPLEDAPGTLVLLESEKTKVDTAERRATSVDVSPSLLAALSERNLQLEADIGGLKLKVQREEKEVRFERDLDQAQLEAGTRVFGFEPDYQGAAQRYLTAFQAFDLDIANLSAADVAARIRSLTPSRRGRVQADLEQWWVFARRYQPQVDHALWQVLQQLGSDAWITRLRDAKTPEALARLAREADEAKVSAPQTRLIAEALMVQGMEEPAATLLQQGLRRFPEHLGLNLTLLDAVAVPPTVLVNAGLTAVRLAPKSSVAWNALGRGLCIAGQFATAESCFDTAAKLDERNLKNAADLAMLFWIRGERRRAAKAAEKILQQNPREEQAKQFRATLLAADGNAKEVLQVLGPLKLEQATLAQLRIWLAVANASRDWTSVRETRKQIQTRFPPTHNMFVAMCEAHLCEGNTPAAEAKARQLLSKTLGGYGTARAQGLIGLSMLDSGRYADAEQAARIALQHAPELFAAHEVLILALLRQGRIPEAITELKRVPEGRWFNAPLPPLALLQLAEGLTRELDSVERTGHPVGQRNIMLAETALGRKKPALAYRTYAEQFRNVPGFVLALSLPMNGDLNYLGLSHHFNAARAAAAVLGGPAEDILPISPKDLPELSKNAWNWLNNEWSNTKKLARNPQHHPQVRRWIHFCRLCPEFATVRDDKALNRVPETDREKWRKMWQEMAEALATLEAD